MSWKQVYEYFFPEPEPTVTVTQLVEEAVVVVEEPKPKDISEPVTSLAKSILETEDWVLDITPADIAYDVDKLVFRNKALALDVPYMLRSYHRRWGCNTKYRCLCDWMTEDEREFMEGVLETYIQRQQEEEGRKRQIQLAADREKFMVLVTK